jgi:Fe-Mn family superoxide dismutase
MSELKQIPLPYDRSDLEPVMSKATVDYHYGHLYKKYVDNVNADKNPSFNRAGAFLHDIYFTQFTEPDTGGKPGELTAELIQRHFKSLTGLKALMKDAAMKIEGSGWVYLSDTGRIRTIPNHEIRRDILLLIDWWEHAWALQYEWDKERYFDTIWRIINWPHIEDRLALM